MGDGPYDHWETDENGKVKFHWPTQVEVALVSLEWVGVRLEFGPNPEMPTHQAPPFFQFLLPSDTLDGFVRDLQDKQRQLAERRADLSKMN